MFKVLVGVTIVLFGLLIWGLVYEATFDYSVCRATERYEDRHSPMWVQHIPGSCSGNPMICRPGMTIVHPARNWTERLYECPSDGMEAFYPKWRAENRPNE